MDNVKWCEAINSCQSKLDFKYNELPKCPHCGEDFDVDDFDMQNVYEEGEHEEFCQHCGFEVLISTHVSWRFSTANQECK